MRASDFVDFPYLPVRLERPSSGRRAEKVAIAGLSHPTRAGEVGVIDSARAVRLCGGVDSENNPNGFAPIGLFSRSIKKAPISLVMPFVIVGDVGRLRRTIIKSGYRHSLAPPLRPPQAIMNLYTMMDRSNHPLRLWPSDVARIDQTGATNYLPGFSGARCTTMTPLPRSESRKMIPALSNAFMT